MREAMPLEAVAVPRPVTVPAPAVLANVTTVALSPVSRLPFASRISAGRVLVAPAGHVGGAAGSGLVAPEATLAVPLVNVRWSAAPTVTEKLELSLVMPVFEAAIVIA